MRYRARSRVCRNCVMSSPKISRVNSALARLEVGIAQVDITPPVGISANPWGKSKSAISTGVHRPLTATALAIHGDRLRFILGLDLGWIGCHECDVVNFRSRLAHEVGVAIDDILVNLSQTHKGPPFCIHEALREGKEFVAPYIESTIVKLISLCKTAAAMRVLADITWEYGKCELGTVRDLPVGDQVVVGFNPELQPDDNLAVGRITDAAGKTIGTIVNYGCHPTSVGWESGMISPDFVGRARELVESATGAPMLYLLGASGNVAPKVQYSGDLSVADRNGEMLGYATLATIAKMLPPASDYQFREVITSGSNLAGWEIVPANPNQEIKVKKVAAKLRHKPLLGEEEMRVKWAPLTATESFLNFRIRKQFEMRIDYVKPGGVVEHPVWFWRLGDAIFIAHGGEAYLELARDLRARNSELKIFFLDMTNGPGYMYVPTKKSYEQNTYQSQQSIMAAGSMEELLEFMDRELKSL